MSIWDGFFSIRPSWMHEPFSSTQFGAMLRDEALSGGSKSGDNSADGLGELVLGAAALVGAGWVIYHFRDEFTLGAAGVGLVVATPLSDWVRKSNAASLSAALASVVVTGVSIWQLEKSGLPEGTVTGFVAHHPQGVLAGLVSTLSLLYARSIWKYKNELAGVAMAGSLFISGVAGIVDGIHDNIVHREMNPFVAAGKAIIDTDKVSSAVFRWSIADLTPNPIVKWGGAGVSKIVTIPFYVGAGTGAFISDTASDAVRLIGKTFHLIARLTTSQHDKPAVDPKVTGNRDMSHLAFSARLINSQLDLA